MRLGSEHNREFSNWQIVPATSVRNLWSVGNNVVEECVAFVDYYAQEMVHLFVP